MEYMGYTLGGICLIPCTCSCFSLTQNRKWNFFGQRICGCTIPASVEGQDGREQPGLVESATLWQRGGMRWFLLSFPTETTLRFYEKEFGGFKVWVFWWNTCLREESSCLHCREAAMGWRWRQYRKKEELARQKKSQGDKFGWILDHTGLGELWNGLGEVKTWALGVWKGEQWVSLHH